MNDTFKSCMESLGIRPNHHQPIADALDILHAAFCHLDGKTIENIQKKGLERILETYIVSEGLSRIFYKISWEKETPSGWKGLSPDRKKEYHILRMDNGYALSTVLIRGDGLRDATPPLRFAGTLEEAQLRAEEQI